MKKMKAIIKQNKESNDFILTEIPIPDIDDSEILVQVKAIGVGIQDGYFFPEKIQFPYPIGMEGSGIIDKIGKDVVDFKEGDRVAFVGVTEPKGGSYAEYMVLGEKSLVVPIPSRMSFIEAAAIPVSGNTMIKVIKALELNPDDTLFIAGASGSNGTFAIQLAKDIGCKTSASASKKNHDYMKSLGVTKAVDYKDPDWIEQVLEWMPGGVDAAIAIQPNTSISSMKVVKDGGKVISVSGDQFTTERNIKSVYFPYNMDVKEELICIIDKIASKEINITIENVYDFEDGLEALEKVRTRRARGKSIIEIK